MLWRVSFRCMSGRPLIQYQAHTCQINPTRDWNASTVTRRLKNRAREREKPFLPPEARHPEISISIDVRRRATSAQIVHPSLVFRQFVRPSVIFIFIVGAVCQRYLTYTSTYTHGRPSVYKTLGTDQTYRSIDRLIFKAASVSAAGKIFWLLTNIFAEDDGKENYGTSFLSIRKELLI